MSGIQRDQLYLSACFFAGVAAHDDENYVSEQHTSLLNLPIAYCALSISPSHASKSYFFLRGLDSKAVAS